MKNKSWLTLLTVLLAIVLAGCKLFGSSTGTSATTGTTATNSYIGTQSPGDLWTATFANGTFTATNKNTANAVTFSGTTALQASGLLQLTVTSSDTPSLVAVGAIGYAYEFPGTATLMQPPGTTVGAVSNTTPVFLVAQAATAGFTTGSQFNWIDVPTSIWTIGSGSCPSTAGSTGNVLGVGSVSAVNGSTITITFDEYDYCGNKTTSAASNNLTDMGNGEVQGTNGGVTITFQVSPSGAFMGDVTSSTAQQVAGFIGMKAPTTAVNKNALLAQNRTFRGFVFRTNGSASSPYTEPVGGNITAGASTISGFTMDPVSGTSAGGGVSIDLGTSQVLSNGVFDGATITTLANNIAHHATFVVNQINGKYFMFGFGLDGVPFNFMLMEQ